MRNYKVIDTFIFGGELEILKMRLDYLYDSVDFFVFSESKITHNGTKKELEFVKNSEMFKEYLDKIVFIVFEPDITNLNFSPNIENIFDSDLWKTERNQRNILKDKIEELSDDNTLILHSDCDEFPDKNKFDEIWEKVNCSNEVFSLEQPTYYYSPLNLLEIKWFGTVAFNHATLINLTQLHLSREQRFSCKSIDNCGYHFSFFLTPEKIQNKIKTYAHQEFNSSDITDIENIKYRMFNGEDVLARPDIKIIKFEKISDKFPNEFYRHELFFRNTFYRNYLKLGMARRKNASMQIPLEIENLQLKVSKHKPKVIVEIGSANGGTLARWFEIPSVETIFSIDLANGIHGGQGFEERTYVISDCIEESNLIKKEFYAINGNSKDYNIITRLEELLNGRKIDFLFIDGDHTYSGVKEDFEIYKRFLSKNAIVGFHDIIESDFHKDVNCFVGKFWSEISKQYKSTEFIYTKKFDRKMSEFMYDISYHKGGFGGIGMIEYDNSKVKINNISLIVPIYNNVDSAIKNIQTTIRTSTLIDQIILYSNGTSKEENLKLSTFANSIPMCKLHIVEKPIGFIKAVNESIKLSKNELILCMNSDAGMYDDWERRILSVLDDNQNGLIGPVKVRNFILGCCYIMKKSVLNKIGMLNEGFGLGYEDDVELSERVERNGYNLGFCEYKEDFGWTPHINFPIYHQQGQTFKTYDKKFIDVLAEKNMIKNKNFKNSEKILVIKDWDEYDILNLIKNNHNDVILGVIKSGVNFEKIRYNDVIIDRIHLFECTPEMNIDEIIISVTKGKQIEYAEISKNKLTWLAKFDDHTSMGILSQHILKNLESYNFSCQEIIGKSETTNKLILDSLNKNASYELGIMFAYPDMWPVLNDYKIKVIYTGVDSTGGIPNFAQNSNNADFLLTPSKKSKSRMENLGVTKPIYVFPHGIEKNRFNFKKRKKDEVFKFLYVGECSDRKGTFHLVNAFLELFKGNQNVKLIMKSNDAMVFYKGDVLRKLVDENENIVWDVSNVGHDYVEKLYDEAHAYVYPSRADTFGMTLIEAMSCGLPIISTSEPGATELIEGRYYDIRTKNVQVFNHPWMLGEWGEPNLEDLKKHMKYVYDNYDEILNSGKLEENSEYVKNNFSWDKVTGDFEKNILPKLSKKVKVITLATSFNRPRHIKNLIGSMKSVRETGIENYVYIVDNTEGELKDEVINTIYNEIDDGFSLYVSDFNMGQRGALLQLLDSVNIDDYDFIQFTDQDNIMNEPISTYTNILFENPDITFVTGYMSKEHQELGWRKTKYGNLCEKRSLRAGHMVMRVKDLKDLYPIHLDAQFGQPHNSSWNAGLDWELTYWNPKSAGRNTNKNFVLCVPGGVLHKGIDSTFYEWPVEENEYTLEELEKMR